MPRLGLGLGLGRASGGAELAGGTLAAVSGPGTFEAVGGTWTLGDLSPVLWTRADTGVTIGDTGTINAALAAWTEAGAGVSASGDDFILTADAGNSTHHLAISAATSLVSGGPCEVTFDAVAGTAGWMSLGVGANSIAWFNLTTGARGTGSGTAYLDHTITALGAGRYRCAIRGTFTVYDTLRVGLGTADNTPTWDAAGTETITVRPVPSFSLGGASIIIQQCVAEWADVRANGNLWAQSTHPGRQPVYWVDAVGPSLVFPAYPWMQADSLASARDGENIPFWFAAAIDSMAGITGRTLYAYGCTLHARSQGLAVPSSETVAALAYRYVDAGTGKSVPQVTASPKASGAIVSSFDGTTGSLLYGDSALVTANSAIAGDATTDRLTLGALRLNSGAFQLFKGVVREVAIHPTAYLSAANLAAAHAQLTAMYGY
jgi:hypothetical protein